MSDKPLVLQSDLTILFDTHAKDAEECKAELSLYADLVKSPEHIHTYKFTYLSLWNAAALGFTEEKVFASLEKYSRFGIPEPAERFIKDAERRAGAVKLYERNGEFILSVLNSYYAKQVKNALDEKDYVETADPLTYKIKKLSRGSVKISLIESSLPVEDLIPLEKGEPLDVSMREVTLSGAPLIVREYQKEAVDAFYNGGKLGFGYGAIVMPCGAGKTLCGMLAMSILKTSTLIITPNTVALRQWIRELLDKTTLNADQIGEYSGEKREIKPVTVCTYQILIKNLAKEDSHFEKIKQRKWGFVIYDEVHMLPAPVFKFCSELQSLYRLGLTATLVREDGKEGHVFSLVGPKRYDVPWQEIEAKGFIAKAYCHEVRVPLVKASEEEYFLANKRARIKLAATNSAKLRVMLSIVKLHPEDSILVIGQYLEQLNEVKKLTAWPIITGKTPTAERERIYDDFRAGVIKILIVSKVANYAIDLPDASVAIQLSGAFGSRQEEAQRLGRILRPKGRNSHFYTIVTKYSEEEEFSMKRQMFLSEQGYAYSLEEAENYEI